MKAIGVKVLTFCVMSLLPGLDTLARALRSQRRTALNRVSPLPEPHRSAQLTEPGLGYGRNETSAQNPRETQPLYYVEHFPELLARIDTALGQQAA